MLSFHSMIYDLQEKKDQYWWGYNPTNTVVNWKLGLFVSVNCISLKQRQVACAVTF